MRRSCFGIAGLVLTLSLAGCGDSVDDGPVSYKGTNTPAIQDQLKLTSDIAKNNKGSAKAADDKSAGKKDAKEADKKPAVEAATDKKKD
jgi:hypothetical protein